MGAQMEHDFGTQMRLYYTKQSIFNESSLSSVWGSELIFNGKICQLTRCSTEMLHKEAADEPGLCQVLHC